MVSSPAVARSETGQPGAFGRTSVQRSRPERLGQVQAPLVETGNLTGCFQVTDMGDQGIERWPALGRVEPGDRTRIGCVRAQAIDGLGRERDQPAVRRGNLRRPLPRCDRRGELSWSGWVSSGDFTPDGSLRVTFTLLILIPLLAVCGSRRYTGHPCRSVAQPGRALRSGRRGRRFESCHSDHDFNGLALCALYSPRNNPRNYILRPSSCARRDVG